MRAGDTTTYLESACDRCGGTGLKDSPRRAVKVPIVPVDERELMTLIEATPEPTVDVPRAVGAVAGKGE